MMQCGWEHLGNYKLLYDSKVLLLSLYLGISHATLREWSDASGAHGSVGVKGKEQEDHSCLAHELNEHVLCAMTPASCTKNQAWRFPRARSMRVERLAPNSKMLAREMILMRTKDLSWHWWGLYWTVQCFSEISHDQNNLADFMNTYCWTPLAEFLVWEIYARASKFVFQTGPRWLQCFWSRGYTLRTT